MNTLNSLFDWVLVAGLRASLLVLAVLAAQWLLKNRLPSRWRYALWLPVLAALLVPALPLLPSWMNWPAAQAEIAEKATSPAPVSPVLMVDTTQEVALPPFLERAEVPTMPPRIMEATSTIKTAAAPAATPVNWRAWLMAAWFIGAGGVSLFVVVSFALTMRRIRRAALPVKAESLAHIAETAQVVGLRRVPRVLQSSAVASPAVCGLWRPTLLLNERFPQDLSADEADMVLRHELTHIRRGDLALNALLCALLALHWWNPLLWLAFFRVRADREAACDAQVLDGEPAVRRAAYGHTLMKMETAFPPTGLCLGFVGILQRGGTLRERIHAIITQPQLNRTMKITIALSILALTIAGIAKAAKAAEETPRREKQFKGMELYAQFDKVKKQWHFGLLPGTNRSKQTDEVKKSMTLTGLDSLLAEMKLLAPQEEVFLVSPDREGAAVTPLDEETQKKLVEFCARHEIILNGEGHWLQQPNRTIAAMEGSNTKRELILSQTEIDGKGLAMIAEKFPALESLTLSYCGITDADLSPLGKLKALKTLTMNDNYDMTGKSFGFVAELKNLRGLNLEQCAALTDEAVAAISKSTTLESLNLGYCKSLTAACAPYLGAMTSLKELNLANVGLPDSAMKDLVKIKSLTSLDIAVSQVTDESLAAIATMPNLKRLGLRACRSVTFNGIKSLAPLRLEYLDINVTGSGKPPLDEDAVIEFAKTTWPGCEVVNSKTATAHLVGLVDPATPKPAAVPKPEAKANELAELKDGEYTLKVTHDADLAGIQFPHSPIPDAAYKPEKDANPLRLQFSEKGKKVTILPDKVSGTLQKRTAVERIYSLSGGLSAGGQLRLNHTDTGIIGTYTEYGSGLPVLFSKRGVVTLSKAAEPAPAPAKDGKKGAQAQPVDLEKIKDKVRIQRGGEETAHFRTDGARLLPRAPGEKAKANDVKVKAAILEESPPRWQPPNTPKTSYLVLSNGADKRLHFRALARLKGSKEFYEMELAKTELEPGEMDTVKIWEVGSIVEEVVLFRLSLGDYAEGITDETTESTKAGAKTPPPRPVDLDQIKDKVRLQRGGEIAVNLRADGERLRPIAPGEKANPGDLAVKIAIKETKLTPIPVQGDPTRPYLAVSHSSDKTTLHFRALARLKGSQEFYEVEGPLEPVDSGDAMTAVHCWESGSLVEEVVLYQFTLAPKAPGTIPDKGKSADASNVETAVRTPAAEGDAKAQKRVADISKQLARNGALPGALLDAQFVQEQVGNGILGPSDFFAFYALKVPAADIPAWRAALKASPVVNGPASYAAPKATAPWWVSKADYEKLKLFGPKPLTGWLNGWVGIAEDGRIFIYSFTM